MYADVLEIDKIVLGLGPQQQLQQIDGFCLFERIGTFVVNPTGLSTITDRICVYFSNGIKNVY